MASTRAVIINGKTYKSLTAAGNRFRLRIGSIAHRCASKLPQWSGWKFKSNQTTRRPASIKVIVLGKKYDSVRQASEQTGETIYWINRWLAEPTVKNCTYVAPDGRRSKSVAELLKKPK